MSRIAVKDTLLVMATLVCIPGICLADEDETERRKVRVEVRRQVHDQDNKAAPERRDQDRRVIRVERTEGNQARQGNPDVRRRSFERMPTNRSENAQQRAESQQRTNQQRERRGRAVRSDRDRDDRETQPDRQNGRNHFRFEIDLPRGNVSAQLQRIIRELTNQFDRELHRDGAPRAERHPDAHVQREGEHDARRHHFVTAIEHLQAAGLHDEANRLRDRYRDLLPEQRLREAAHRGEHDPDGGGEQDAMQELRNHTERRLNELQHELEVTRQDGERRWDELERELRQQFEDIKREMSRRLEELSLQVERSRRDGSGYGR